MDTRTDTLNNLGAESYPLKRMCLCDSGILLVLFSFIAPNFMTFGNIRTLVRQISLWGLAPSASCL